MDKISELEKSLKDAEDKAPDLENGLDKLKTQKESFGSKCMTNIANLNDHLKLAIDSNEDLRESLRKSQIEVLTTGDEAFDKAKEQVLCLYPKVDFSEVDFHKVVHDGRLVELQDP